MHETALLYSPEDFSITQGLCKKKRENDKQQTIMWQETQDEVF